MLHIVTLLWDANKNSLSFSKQYDESWVEKLYRGFSRNLTVPFKFVCYVDHKREFSEPIEQRFLNNKEPSYGDCIQPYELGVPMILVGLDTVVTGNCDGLAQYCMSADIIALPRDPYKRSRACNGVALVPVGQAHVAHHWNGENDMEWMRAQPHVFLDDIYPRQVQSYKGAVKRDGLCDTKIVYFHGEEKPHQLGAAGWIGRHWR